MRLATFAGGAGAPALGVVEGASVISLQAAHERLRGGRSAELESMLALIRGGAGALELAARARARGAGRLPPCAGRACGFSRRCREPAQIRDFMCFEEHLKNSFAQAAKLTGEERRDPGGLVSAADLLQGEPVLGERSRGRRGVAVLLAGDGLRARAGLRDRRPAGATSTASGRGASTSSASRSSTTRRPATPR